jgi:hypothetical protein
VPCHGHHAAFCKANNIKDEGAKARVLTLEDFCSAVHRGCLIEVKKARGSIWEKEYTVIPLTDADELRLKEAAAALKLQMKKREQEAAKEKQYDAVAITDWRK